ncbi:His Kinase A (phospho-acceptor) domain-containing protein [Clostridium grantii DSM 8605]|uniref:histidine kinase n=2 Tax=Clostridium TaxID=1485 RepID=A0A1M5RPQ1_9CLOT|nr:His Kinase A (phospho-acceptor) domain-containing protein [Clostridium grantii DSM 8605]
MKEFMVNIKDDCEIDKVKMDFFANISHEFKTPLNILLGSMQLLELYSNNGTIIDPQLKLEKYLKSMKNNTLKLVRLVNNIIDLSKIDSNYFYLEKHNYNIVEMVESVLKSITTYSEMKKISIVLDKKIHRKIIAFDIGKIERALLNLLSNALKFTDESGCIQVSVDADEKWVYISVKDDGIGMHEEKMHIIFNRFSQAEKSFIRNNEGSGIGLSLVKSIVKMHGGNIKVYSEYGKGSEFIIELPINIVENDEGNQYYSQYEDSRVERLRAELSDL